MSSLSYKEVEYSGIKDLNYLKLDSCTERGKEKVDWEESWYKDPYDYACVDVKYTINKNGTSNEAKDLQYYLIKESKDSGWIILESGQG